MNHINIEARKKFFQCMTSGNKRENSRKNVYNKVLKKKNKKERKIMENKIELDVREDIAAKNDPFKKIMAEVAKLTNGGTLILHTPFVPKPLLTVMKAKGFASETEEISSSHYITTFTKGA